MPYNPGIQDISGQLFANAGADAAHLKFAGSQAMAQGISQAGQGIAAGVTQVGQNYQEAKGLDSAADALGPDGNGMVSAEWLDKFHSGNLQAKKAMFGTVTSQWVNQHMQAQTEQVKADTKQTAEQTRKLKQGNDQNQDLMNFINGAQQYQGGGVITAPSGRKYKLDSNGHPVPLSMADPSSGAAPGQPSVDATWLNTLAYS